MGKRFILSLLGGLFGALLFGQNITDAKGLKQGEWIKNHPGTDKIRYKGQFKDNEPVGTFTYYEPDGKKSAEITHLGSGKARSVTFYPSGKVNSEGNYIKQKKDSTWSYYDEEGKLLSKQDFQNDQRHGLNLVYFPDGALALEQRFDQGKLHGNSVAFYPNGKIKSENYFVHDVAEGPSKTYAPNGVLTSEGMYSNNMPVGLWKEYNENGELRQTIEYGKNSSMKKTPMNGEFIEYFDNELPMKISNYKDGVLHGPYVLYHEGGRWKLEEKIDPRSEEKEMHRVPENHVIKIKCVYDRGVLQGKVYEYNAQGKLISEINYVNGERK